MYLLKKIHAVSMRLLNVPAVLPVELVVVVLVVNIVPQLEVAVCVLLKENQLQKNYLLLRNHLVNASQKLKKELGIVEMRNPEETIVGNINEIEHGFS